MGCSGPGGTCLSGIGRQDCPYQCMWHHQRHAIPTMRFAQYWGTFCLQFHLSFQTLLKYKIVYYEQYTCPSQGFLSTKISMKFGSFVRKMLLMRLEGHAEYAAVLNINLLLFDYGWQIDIVNQLI